MMGRAGADVHLDGTLETGARGDKCARQQQAPGRPGPGEDGERRFKTVSLDPASCEHLDRRRNSMDRRGAGLGEIGGLKSCATTSSGIKQSPSSSSCGAFERDAVTSAQGAAASNAAAAAAVGHTKLEVGQEDELARKSNQQQQQESLAKVERRQWRGSSAGDAQGAGAGGAQGGEPAHGAWPASVRQQQASAGPEGTPTDVGGGGDRGASKLLSLDKRQSQRQRHAKRWAPLEPPCKRADKAPGARHPLDAAGLISKLFFG